MSRLPIPGQDDDVWGDILNDFLGIAHNSDGTLKNVVHASGDEAVGGVNTFVVSPKVPTPTASNDAATKAYVDSNVGLGTNGFPVGPHDDGTNTFGISIAGEQLQLFVFDDATSGQNTAKFSTSISTPTNPTAKMEVGTASRDASLDVTLNDSLPNLVPFDFTVDGITAKLGVGSGSPQGSVDPNGKIGSLYIDVSTPALYQSQNGGPNGWKILTSFPLQPFDDGTYRYAITANTNAGTGDLIVSTSADSGNGSSQFSFTADDGAGDGSAFMQAAGLHTAGVSVTSFETTNGTQAQENVLSTSLGSYVEWLINGAITAGVIDRGIFTYQTAMYGFKQSSPPTMTNIPFVGLPASAIYTKDGGGGLAEVAIAFQTGSPQIIAKEGGLPPAASSFPIGPLDDSTSTYQITAASNQLKAQIADDATSDYVGSLQLDSDSTSTSSDAILTAQGPSQSASVTVQTIGGIASVQVQANGTTYLDAGNAVTNALMLADGGAGIQLNTNSTFDVNLLTGGLNVLNPPSLSRIVGSLQAGQTSGISSSTNKHVAFDISSSDGDNSGTDFTYDGTDISISQEGLYGVILSGQVTIDNGTDTIKTGDAIVNFSAAGGSIKSPINLGDGSFSVAIPPSYVASGTTVVQVTIFVKTTSSTTWGLASGTSIQLQQVLRSV